MAKAKPKRPSADETRNKILKAALALFIQHGFAGTSMGAIAEEAEINQSLISHHFGDKQQLWQQVKAMVITNTEVKPINLHPETLQAFLKEAIQQRLTIYAKNPNLIRLISWQRLEANDNKHGLGGVPGHIVSPDQWLEPITFLQNKKLLKPELKPELILIWLITTINGIIWDDMGLLSQPKNKKAYIDMIVEGLSEGLTP